MFDDLGDVLAMLSHVDPEATDAERIDAITALEHLKSAVAAAQVRVTADFVDSQARVAEAWRERAQECAEANDFDGWRQAREQERCASLDDVSDTRLSPLRRRRPRSSATIGVSGQVALARRESPSRGALRVAAAVTLARWMPHTLALLQTGELSEWRAELVVREVAILTREQQTAVDDELADDDAGELGRCGDRELVRRVRAICYRIDAASVVERCVVAQTNRRVSLRPAPDAMAYLTALLPVAAAVSVHASLTASAASAKAAGDPRGRGQVMADTLVSRLTGASATASGEPAVPTVEIQLVMTDRALLRGDDTAAQIPGYGTVPAGWARQLVTDALDKKAGVFLRRLYAHPADGTLVAMDSHRRTFVGGLRAFIVARDGTCQTPWCDAPIAQIDHIQPYADGGPTTADNGQGACVHCNLRDEIPGWRSAVATGPPGHHHRHEVVTTTPTGHQYRSLAPPLLPGLEPDDPRESRLEAYLEALLAA